MTFPLLNTFKISQQSTQCNIEMNKIFYKEKKNHNMF